jgi:hypothetical protein
MNTIINNQSDNNFDKNNNVVNNNFINNNLISKNSFFDELNKSINNNDEDSEKENNVDKCLISGDILESDFIQLYCKHKFNFKHIYNEVINQKMKKTYNIYDCNYLKSYQIRCPFCRKKQNGLLPQRKNFKNVLYVNSPLHKTMCLNECKYLFKSGVFKNKNCNKKCEKDYCLQHIKIMEKRNNKKQCSFILRTGIHKGKNCSKYSLNNEKFCKLHLDKNMNSDKIKKQSLKKQSSILTQDLCKAICKSGNQCSKRRKDNFDFCGIHIKNQKNE